MTKKEFVDKLYADLKETHTKGNIKEILDATLSGVEDVLANGEELGIYGFGTFYTKYYPPRQAKNPRTGEDIMVSESTKVKFRPSNTLLQ